MSRLKTLVMQAPVTSEVVAAPEGADDVQVQELNQWLGDRWRRKGWILDNMTPRKLANIFLAGVEYATKRERMSAWPVVVKIDISPLCNLRCTVCIHADSHGEEYLEQQHFDRSQRMTVPQYRKIIDEIKGKSSAVSLYYLGDPLVHPDLDEMCSIGRDAGLNVHLSTNFSFNWSDDRIRRHAESGVTHLTVCVDGLSQEKYGRTRVGGHIKQVLSNLERLCRYKKEKGLKFPKIEVQYLVFEYNKDEIRPAIELFKKLGVDQVCLREGSTENWASWNPRVEGPKKNRPLPQCQWPHFFMLVKYDGDVIPCCLHRSGDQYSLVGDKRTVGNVFTTSIREIWNSPSYRQLRQIVSNPTKGHSKPGSTEGFCHGCSAVYEVSYDQPGPGEVAASSQKAPEVPLLSIGSPGAARGPAEPPSHP